MVSSWEELLRNEINRVEKVLLERNKVAKETGEDRQGSLGEMAIRDAIKSGLIAIEKNDIDTIINTYRRLVVIT